MSETVSHPGGDSCVSEVRELVRSLLTEGYPTVARTAAALGMSARTLQRRLHAAGVSYRDLVADARLDVARTLLEETALPLQDIAKVLGFSRPASLSRLVARRTGKPPRKIRRESGRYLRTPQHGGGPSS